MINQAFWKTTGVLWRYPRPLSIALLGALVSAACYGAGLGLLLWVFKLLLQNRQSLQHILCEFAAKMPEQSWLRELIESMAMQLPNDAFYGFLITMAMIATLTLIGSTGRYVHELLTLTVSQRGAFLWRTRLFHRLVRMPWDLSIQQSQSDAASRLIMDTHQLEMGFRSILGKAVAEITKGLTALLIALWVNTGLTLLALISAPLIAVVLRRFGKQIRRASRKALAQRGKFIASLAESLGGLAVVKTHNAEGYERRRFGNINRELFTQEMKMRQARALASPVIETLALFAVIAVASITSWFIFRRDVEPAEFMVVLVCLAAAGGSLKPLTALYNTLQEASAAAVRILELHAMPIERLGMSESADSALCKLPDLPLHQRTVVFDSVSYTYPGKASPAIRNISLDVKHGQHIAVVGPNGSGKTTLLNLLPRLIEPQHGVVLVDDHPIAQYDLRSLRKQIAVVSQQALLFEGTIAQNIAYGQRWRLIKEIEAAAQAAYADEFIRALPGGYQSKLGEQGVGLSGGQKQRLCIARAILRNPAILILDEATSQIDADSEAKITQAVRSFSRGRTTFVIAHRLSTVIDADRIVVMDQGQIVDQGKHDELLTRCGLYRTLVETQMISTTNARADLNV